MKVRGWSFVKVILLLCSVAGWQRLLGVGGGS